VGRSALAARIERHLLAVWYGGQRPGLLLRALEALHRLLRRLRRTRQPAPLAVPVIVVGNLVAGGSGKTPLVIALVKCLAAEGFRPGVISRGYGRSGSALVLVDADTLPGQAGDEPVLIAQATAAPVAVCAARVRAAEALIRRGCNLLLSDDGLQHAALHRDIEIEVVDAARGYGNGRLLPAGPLREPAGRAVDFRILNGEPAAGIANQGDVVMRLVPDEPLGLLDDQPRSWDSFAGLDCAAVAGIGNPQRFFATLEGQGIHTDARAFPDHHAYTPADLEFAQERPLLMTDKDAIKCRGFARAGWYRVPVSADLPESFFRQVLERLRPA